MGLIEIITLTLCLNNATNCPGDNETWADVIDSQRLRNLQQLEDEIQAEHFVVTTLNNEKLSGLDQINGSYTGTGVAFDLLEILRDKFHFNYTVIKPQFNVWGSSEYGILTLLKQKKADLSAAFLPVLTEYSKDITYSPSLDTGEWVVLMNRPKESATGSGLLAPFTLPVWILILLSLLVVGPVIYFIIYIQARLLCKDDHNTVFPLPSCMWFVYGALLKQGTTLSPATDSSRLLFSTWWLFITILTAFYTANLTAFLTLSRFTLPINEAKDIGAKKSKWVTTKGNALEDTIRNEAIQSLLGYPNAFVDHPDDDILNSYVKNRGMMFIREKPIIEYVMYEDYKKKTRANVEEEKRCTFVITKFSVVSFPRAFAYTKGFKYKPLFDTAIQHLVESGIVKYKLREGLPNTEICPHNLRNKERQLRNADLLMTYEIVGGGFIISAIIFIIELFLQKYKKKKNTTDKKKSGLISNVLNNNYFTNHNPKKMKSTWMEKDRHLGWGDLRNNPKLINNSNFITPPPSYHTLFTPEVINRNIKKKNINGREYWVYNSNEGNRMVPLRTPSALLFQFTH